MSQVIFLSRIYYAPFFIMSIITIGYLLSEPTSQTAHMHYIDSYENR